ncbi:MAG TPA: protein-disulfide reductase DsbD N-terminal domain-containing protein [Gemmatimonadaceae bacterium]|nr:protein-disulfide reductase DsbD N-terminal domain-containing protein [Gemmatimonadaceae bacterium]
MNRLAFLTLPMLMAAGTSLSLKPVRWSLVGGETPREVAAGRTLPITVQADIAKGWHIYSLTQQAGGPIPLRIAVQGAPDVIVRGVIKAPKPDKYFDKNFGMTTELYSGKPRFIIPVGITGRAGKGVRRVEVTARYQVCSDKLCLPPRTDTVRVALSVAVRK